jgi:hypothetical protein
LPRPGFTVVAHRSTPGSTGVAADWSGVGSEVDLSRDCRASVEMPTRGGDDCGSAVAAVQCHTSTKMSEQPSMTAGVFVNPGAQLTIPNTLSTD